MENYKIYIRQFFRVLIIILVIWFIWHVGKDWLKPRIINALGGFTQREVKETIDTLEVKRDTIYLPQKERIIKVPITTPVVTPSKSLTPSFKGKQENSTLDSINKINPQTPLYTYTQPVSDTLIDGTIITISTGKIITQELKYTPKFPMFVKESTTIVKTKQETLSNKDKSYFGLGLTSTSNRDIGGLILYQTPKKIQIQAGYTRTLDKPLIDETNKGIVSVSLIKLF